ncbi:DUF4129 domain-containing protein [Pedococcus sp. KACC 23699]|uniref:DUF4129 domain-containing protein n=1 Tax=Pedococcus sp. KACC 23699 TaxID=3149228 RepID=A0AAU7JW67_9MICO
MSRSTVSSHIFVLPARLEPGNDEARRWLRDELAKPAYRDTRDPLQRAMDAIGRWLSDLLNGMHGPSNPLPTAVAVLVTLALVALVVHTLRFVRRTRRGPGEGASAVLGDERLTAAQYRTRAEQALDDGRYADCVLDALRAVAAGAVERTLLEDVPSLTAHEIATRLESPFPGQAQDLRAAANRFDAVAYGGQEATRSDAERLLALDRTIATARPVRPQVTASQKDPETDSVGVPS